jgi:GDP-4-dehydro-6-deoxy-D-mannose reductase
MRVLVTGCWGFVGRHMVAHLVEEGHEVWGVDKKATVETFPGREYLPCDLTDPRSIGRLIEEAQPEGIVHLAAQASAGRSFEEPLRTFTANLMPTLHILETLRQRSLRTRVLVVGSAEEYGPVPPDALPVREGRTPDPQSPYAMSKHFQTQAALLYARLYRAEVVATRSFNHTGPGQKEIFVLPNFARQVVQIRRGEREPVLRVGNLEVRRDFLDVRDVVRAYLLLLEKGRVGEVYNVCSGRSYRLRDLVALLCERAGVDVRIEVDPSRLRPVDTEELRGDPSKLVEHTGWEPRYSIEDTIDSLLADWERRVDEELQTREGQG